MKTFLFFLLTICSLIVTAQAPSKMSYQAIIRNSAGIIQDSTQVLIIVKIHQGSPSGTVIFNETHNVLTNRNGLATIEIGSKSSLLIDWRSNDFYIETNINVNGVTTSTTSQILSVPYALHANYADSSGTPGPQGIKGDTGVAGNTPFIGTDGKWHIGTTNTNINATGPKGDPGNDGNDGNTPFIGTDGKWHIGTTNTNVNATGPQGIQGTGFNHFIGDTIGGVNGGIIIQVYKINGIEHGIIAKNFNKSLYLTSSSSTEMNCSSTNGMYNHAVLSAGIVTTTGYCAIKTLDSINTIYNTNWYIPSIKELENLFISPLIEQLVNTNTNNVMFWSSSRSSSATSIVYTCIFKQNNFTSTSTPISSTSTPASPCQVIAFRRF